MVSKSRFPDLKNKLFNKSYIVNKKGKICKNSNYRKLNEKKSLRCYEPVDLEDLKNISKFLKRTLTVWSKGRLLQSIGKKSEKSEIDVEYDINNNARNAVNPIGHYTLKGKREPKIEGQFLQNNCFFNVVASQTGIEPNHLRRVARKMKTKLKNTSNVKKYLSQFKRHLPILGHVELRGGAQYTGKSHKDAKEILDSSQNGKSHPHGDPGHPRGHASDPEVTGPKKSSVEKYSKTGTKTGFESTKDQDYVAHLVLKHKDAQDVMDLLNDLKEAGLKEAVKIRAKDLNVDEDKLPDIQNWYDGKRIGEPGRISSLVMVLKHFYERYNDEDADVFVLTFYPKL